MVNITLKKIAQTLNISISTVSRALKNHPDISVKTKTRVNEIAEFLDYEPNIQAVNLRTQKNNIFGVMLPSLNISFYSSFIAALEEESSKLGYLLIIMQSNDDPENEKKIIKIFRQKRVSGIFACLSPNSVDFVPYQKAYDVDIPIIFYDKLPEGKHYCVGVDNAKAIELIAKELIKKGKKNILALFGNKNFSISKERQVAFEQFFKNKPHIKLNIEDCNNGDDAYKKTLAYYKRNNKPDVLFCMSDEILTGSMIAIHQLKIKYPSDTGIISISDGIFPKYYFPNINFVETSGFKLGLKAFSSMIAIINKEELALNILNEPVLNEGASL